MSRYPDWHTRLIQYLSACAARQFAWGQHDCALFAAGGVEAMTGVDLAADYRGQYETALGGARLLKAAGYESHIALVADSLPPIGPAYACPGDIAAVEEDGGRALGIVQGAHIFVLRPECARSSLGLVPLTAADAAWRV